MTLNFTFSPYIHVAQVYHDQFILPALCFPLFFDCMLLETLFLSLSQAEVTADRRGGGVGWGGGVGGGVIRLIVAFQPLMVI